MIRVVTVYKATNIKTDDFYIGITGTRLTQRKGSHLHSARKGSKMRFHCAIRKYGEASFIFEPITILHDYESAFKEEIRLIAELKPRYNMTKGGEIPSDYRHSPEVCKMIGQKARLKNLGQKRSPEFCARIKEVRRTNKAVERSVKRITICLNDGREFESATAAGKFYNIDNRSVSASAAKEWKHANGLVFRYKNNVSESDFIDVRELQLNSLKRRLKKVKPNMRFQKRGPYKKRGSL